MLSKNFKTYDFIFNYCFFYHFQKVQRGGGHISAKDRINAEAAAAHARSGDIGNYEISV